MLGILREYRNPAEGEAATVVWARPDRSLYDGDGVLSTTTSHDRLAVGRCSEW